MRNNSFPAVAITLLQTVWCLPQNLLGGLTFLLHRKRPRERYRFSLAVGLGKNANSMSLGAFLFIGDSGSPERDRRTRAHEYGHTVQSLILGPLYLPLIGLPSLIWCDCFAGWRARRKVAYGAFYTERWANALAARYAPLDFFGAEEAEGNGQAGPRGSEEAAQRR